MQERNPSPCPLGQNAFNDEIQDRGQNQAANDRSPKRIKRIFHRFPLAPLAYRSDTAKLSPVRSVDSIVASAGVAIQPDDCRERGTPPERGGASACFL